MRTRLVIEGHELIVMRNSFSGELSYILDGEKGVLENVLNLNTQFVVNKELKNEIAVGDSIVTVVHERPRLFAAFRDHTFTILKDGEVIKVVKGR